MNKLLIFTFVTCSFLSFENPAKAEFISIFASKTSYSYLDLNSKPLSFARYKVALGSTVYGSRHSLASININEIPEWSSWEEMKSAFNLILNERNLDDREISGFLRRITWLYRDDGCFTRAGLAAEKLLRAGFPPIKQFYIFSDLRYWNYHVALAARLGNQVFIFDPAFNWNEPMPLDSWRKQFTYNSSPQNVEAAVCDRTAWDPDGNCTGLTPDHVDSSTGRNLTEWRYHWQEQERANLAENAELYLGEQPPWLGKQH